MSTSLPNFLIIGAMKSGTTSLYHYVRAHPQVFMPNEKELAFFCDEPIWARGIEWYRAQFEGARPEHLARGEATPDYTKYPGKPGVPARIAAELGRVKLIYIVRHPIERMVSQYFHFFAKGEQTRPLDEALLSSRQSLAISSYAMQLEQYLEHFDRDDILIITSEDLKEKRQATLARVFRHIGVTAEWTSAEIHMEHLRRKRLTRPTMKRLHSIPAYRRLIGAIPSSFKLAAKRRFDIVDKPIGRGVQLRPTTRKELEERLRPDIVRLQKYMDPSFDGWGLI